MAQDICITVSMHRGVSNSIIDRIKKHAERISEFGDGKIVIVGNYDGVDICGGIDDLIMLKNELKEENLDNLDIISALNLKIANYR